MTSHWTPLRLPTGALSLLHCTCSFFLGQEFGCPDASISFVVWAFTPGSLLYCTQVDLYTTHTHIQRFCMQGGHAKMRQSTFVQPRRTRQKCQPNQFVLGLPHSRRLMVLVKQRQNSTLKSPFLLSPAPKSKHRWHCTHISAPSASHVQCCNNLCRE